MPNQAKQWVYLAGAILCEVSGSLSLKASLNNSLFYIPVVIGFLAAFTFLAAVLRAGMSLGVAYGIWGASGVALTAVMSNVLFNEPLNGIMLLGIMIIIAGVLCVELGSQAAKAKLEEKVVA